MASFNNSEINPTPIFTGETPDTLNIFPKGSGIINKNNPVYFYNLANAYFLNKDLDINNE